MIRRTNVTINFASQDAAPFEESKHPRAGNGEFGSGGGGKPKSKAQQSADAHRKAAEAHRKAAEAHANGEGGAKGLSDVARKHSEGVDGGDNAHQFSARNAHHNSESGDTEGAVTHHRLAAKEHERMAAEAEKEEKHGAAKKKLHSALKRLDLRELSEHTASAIEQLGHHAARG